MTNKLHNIKRLGIILMMLVSLVQAVPVFASVYTERDAANKQLEQQKAALQQVRGKVSTLQEQLATFKQSIDNLSTQININTTEINDTEKRIRQIEAELAVTKEQISELVQTIYKDGQTSSLEMLVGSNKLSDYFDKQQYLDTTRDKLTKATAKVIQLKEQQETRQSSLKTARTSLEGNKVALQSEQQKQEQLLESTKGQETEYQALVEQTKAKKNALDSQIAALSKAPKTGTTGPAIGSVKRGQVIGYEGSTGNSSGCHLHFTVYSGGKTVNPAPLIESGQLGKPENYGPRNITQPYGPATWSNPWYTFHDGLDIATGCGSPIYAAADGDIVKNTRNDGTGFGHYIVINHNNGLVSLYAHMQ